MDRRRSQGSPRGQGNGGAPLTQIPGAQGTRRIRRATEVEVLAAQLYAERQQSIEKDKEAAARDMEILQLRRQVAQLRIQVKTMESEALREKYNLSEGLMLEHDGKDHWWACAEGSDVAAPPSYGESNEDGDEDGDGHEPTEAHQEEA